MKGLPDTFYWNLEFGVWNLLLWNFNACSLRPEVFTSFIGRPAEPSASAPKNTSPV